MPNIPSNWPLGSGSPGEEVTCSCILEEDEGLLSSLLMNTVMSNTEE
jgi:hypothetical protein